MPYLVAYPDALILHPTAIAARLRAYKLNKTNSLKIYEVKEIETVPPWPFKPPGGKSA